MTATVALAKAPNWKSKGQGVVSTDTKMSASDAMQYAIKMLGSLKRAETVLEAHLLAGRLRAFAKAQIVDVDFGPVRANVPIENTNSTMTVFRAKENRWINVLPPFWNERASMYGEKLWHWDDGYFASVEPMPGIATVEKSTGALIVKLPKRRTFYEVHFIKKDIVAAIYANVADSKKRVMTTYPGAPKKPRIRLDPFGWENIFGELYARAKQGTLHDSGPTYGVHRGARQRLIDFIEAKFSDLLLASPADEPSRSTVGRRVDELIKMNAQANLARRDEPT